MKFVTHNDRQIETGGTFLQGKVESTYSTLVKIFGEPTESDGYKTDAEWLIKFEDGNVATIYNWKDGKNYNGASGKKTEVIKCWHIGGFNEKAVENVRKVISDYEK
jgi:hypothetical protein